MCFDVRGGGGGEGGRGEGSGRDLSKLEIRALLWGNIFIIWGPCYGIVFFQQDPSYVKKMNPVNVGHLLLGGILPCTLLEN